jgi:hypothetical protein
MTFAIIGCEGDVGNTRFLVTGPERKDARVQVLGEWHRTEPTSRRTTFAPEQPANGWTVDQPLGILGPSTERLRAFAGTDDGSHRGTDDVRFTREELVKLTPGEWIYSRDESDGDGDDVRSVNRTARSLDELDAVADQNSCFE